MTDTGNIIFPIISCVLIIISTFSFGFAIGVKKEHKRYEKWLKEHLDGVAFVEPVPDDENGKHQNPDVYLTPYDRPDKWRDGQVVKFYIQNHCPREKT